MIWKKVELNTKRAKISQLRTDDNAFEYDEIDTHFQEDYEGKMNSIKNPKKGLAKKKN